MPQKYITQSARWAMALVFSVVLAGCGGGGGSTDPAPGPSVPAPTSYTMTGVVATGAPAVNAQVLFKDRNGKTASAETNAEGRFTLNSANETLAAPVIVRAVPVGGPAMHSVLHQWLASGDPAEVNITQLTEAVVALALGKDPYAAFEANEAPSATATTQAETKLKTVLAPTLADNSVPASDSLIITRFVANHAGLDAVLDAVAVQVIQTTESSPPEVRLTSKTDTTQTVTVTSTSTGTTTLDASPPPVVDALAKVKETWNAAFASAVTPTSLATLVSADYLNGGETRTDFVNSIDHPTVGTTFSLPVIRDCAAADLCALEFVMREPSGATEVLVFPFKKQADGRWLWHGDQMHAMTEVQFKLSHEERKNQLPTRSQSASFYVRTNPAVQSAIFQASYDSGVTWQDFAKVSSQPPGQTCNTGEALWVVSLPGDPSVTLGNCQYPQLQLSTAVADKIRLGKPRFRVTTYVNADFTVVDKLNGQPDVFGSLVTASQLASWVPPKFSDATKTALETYTGPAGFAMAWANADLNNVVREAMMSTQNGKIAEAPRDQLTGTSVTLPALSSAIPVDQTKRINLYGRGLVGGVPVNFESAYTTADGGSGGTPPPACDPLAPPPAVGSPASC